MRSRLSVVAGTAILLATGACGPFAGAPQPRNDLITREQLASGEFHNAYEVVQALHSNWLASKQVTFGVSGPPQVVVVYYDAVRMGGVEELKAIPLAGVAAIQHFDGPAATARWGVGHANGVILVSSQALSDDTARATSH